MGRRGISPILAVVLLIGIVIAMTGGVYTFIKEGQESVISESERAELETVNVSCTPNRISWWINNTGETPVRGPADIYIKDSDGINTSISRTAITIDSGFSRAFGSGELEIAPGREMKLGGEYSLELDFRNGKLSSFCKVGGEWWNQNWDYRRALELDTTSDNTAEISLDASELVGEGKLRSDCADARVVNRGEVAFYDIRSCDPDGSVSIVANLSSPSPGKAYVYYGNLQAGGAEVSITESSDVSPSLGPEERINFY